MFKFYNHFVKVGDSGLVGIYIFIFLMLALTIFSGYWFYRYMVFGFMNGRILDLYRRLSGQYKAFFTPSDYEVSLNYLRWVISRYKKKDCVILSERKIIKDKYGKNKPIYFIKILKIVDNVLQKSRLFYKDYNGALIEVPQRKIMISKQDLRHLKKMHKKNRATVYSGNDEKVDMDALVAKTKRVLSKEDMDPDQLLAVDEGAEHEPGYLEGRVQSQHSDAFSDDVNPMAFDRDHNEQALNARAATIDHETNLMLSKGPGAGHGRGMTMHQPANN